MTLALLAALAALLAGPLAYDALRRSSRTLSLLDGLVFVAIPALILLHVLPWAVEAGSVLPLLALAAGAAVPVVIEHGLPRAGRRTHLTAVALGLSGLLVHAALDGAALAPSTGAGSPAGALTLAIVLHRLPVGLAVWWLVRPRAGQRAAAAGIGALIAATLVGYWTGGQAADSLEASAVGLYQAFVGGTLIHVVFHDHVGVVRAPGTAPSPRAEGMGAVLALVILAGYLSIHSRAAGHGELLLLEDAFLRLALLSAPALLVAYVALGLVGTPARPRLRRWIGPHGPLALDALFLSLPLLGLPLAVARAGAAAAAEGLAARNGRPPAGEDPDVPDVPDAPDAPDAPDGSDGSDGSALPDAPPAVPVPLPVAFRSAVDRSGPWVLLSLGVAAVLLALTGPGSLADLPSGAAVGVMALAGLPFYLAPVAGTVVAAALLGAGLSPGAALAFMITVSVAGRTLPRSVGGVPAVHAVHAVRAVQADRSDRSDRGDRGDRGGSGGHGGHGGHEGLVATAGVTALAVGVGLTADLVTPLTGILSAPPPVGEMAGETGSPLRVGALLVLAALLARSLLVRGVRVFAGELRVGTGHSHHHAHAVGDGSGGGHDGEVHRRDPGPR